MKKKILITGILGYISRTLCDVYKNNDCEIIGIDSQFIPDKVAWLKENNISYYHRDLFNIKDLLKNVDVVIHTAGITAVPTVLSQSNPTIDNEIIKIGVEGTRQIIEHTNKDCKILFLSSHVIFESLKDVMLGINEEYPPCPSLAYACSKHQSEKDLFESSKSFIITRLASVYGYNSSIRWKILPNLFSKMASQNEKIKIFGNGNNVKPLIGILDVCEAVKLLEESNCSREIFNLVNEHKTVREIAEICKNCCTDLKMEFTSDDIPNLGYTLSNNKLLGMGFKFKQNITTEISRMIDTWKNT